MAAARRGPLNGHAHTPAHGGDQALAAPLREAATPSLPAPAAGGVSTPQTPLRSGITARPSKELPFQVRHGSRSRPLVALTFHGQGEPDLAEAVLHAAERAGAHITVMAVGVWLDAHPQIAPRIVAAGHDLGNHTQHHRDMTGMSAEAVYREIDACAQRLYWLTGSKGTWFRPSYLPLATPLIQGQARVAGYRHCLSYDVDSLDYADPGPDAVHKTVLSAVRPGSVVSMHMGYGGTLEALPGIFDGLRRRGLEPVTATQLLQPSETQGEWLRR